jgi:serine/threonine-protein kinase SRPK3
VTTSGEFDFTCDNSPFQPPLTSSLASCSIQVVLLIRNPVPTATHSQKFVSPSYDGVEDLEQYKPDGYHPISIGDTYGHGRYKVLHKLGYEARLLCGWHAKTEALWLLKALRADRLASSAEVLSDIAIPTMLQRFATYNLQMVLDHFIVHGPNGAHRFIIYPFAGPVITAVKDRVQGDLARRLAKQTRRRYTSCIMQESFMEVS